MGESVSEATLTRWVKAIGDRIEEDDTVVEVATDKVDSEVPSPVKGILKEILFEEGQVAQVGDVIALLEVEGSVEEESAAIKMEAPPVVTPVVETSIPENPIPGIEILDRSNLEPSASRGTSEDRFYSPLVKSIAQQEGLSAEELEAIVGSGSEGRVTKQDVLDYIKLKSTDRDFASTGHVSAPVQNPEVRVTAATPVEVVKAANGDEIIEMDRMRRLIADHMVNSIRTSPHVFSVVEADVTNLVNWRNKVKDSFKKREGENITFTPLIIEAITKALKDFPMINVSVDGNNIIKRKHINIGMAAALPSGNLIVPVIKDADQLSLVGISKAVNDLANRARGNKLKPDDTQGGTFTFTNIGAFGNIFGMPIINQPQAAILAVGTITKKPAVLETPDGDVIAIRHMMYLTMSYDHRVIDGALGGTFLKRVGDYLENWDKEREV